jgi:hypothetical protein
MTVSFTIDNLVQSRLEDLSNQCRTLLMKGDRENAELLHKEALELASLADTKYLFLTLHLSV